MAILIDLNDARKKLNELEGSAEYNKGVTDAFNTLFDLQPIEVEPKHGHWIGIDDYPHETWECDRCGQMVDTDYPPNYCPNCGAKMDK